MFQRASNGGSGGMTVKVVTLTAGANTVTCTMRSGTYGFYSYTKGYVENGV